MDARSTTRSAPPTVTPEQAAKALAECIAKGWVKPPATKG
jgi:hypothetical protein